MLASLVFAQVCMHVCLHLHTSVDRASVPSSRPLPEHCPSCHLLTLSKVAEEQPGSVGMGNGEPQPSLEALLRVRMPDPGMSCPRSQAACYHHLGGLKQQLILSFFSLFREGRILESVSLSRSQGVGRTVFFPEAQR